MAHKQQSGLGFKAKVLRTFMHFLFGLTAELSSLTAAPGAAMAAGLAVGIWASFDDMVQMMEVRSSIEFARQRAAETDISLQGYLTYKKTHRPRILTASGAGGGNLGQFRRHGPYDGGAILDPHLNPQLGCRFWTCRA